MGIQSSTAQQGKFNKKSQSISNGIRSLSASTSQRHEQRMLVKNQIITIKGYKIKIGELLGCGGFADVFECSLLNGSKEQQKMEFVAKLERNGNIEFDTEHRILSHLKKLKADFVPGVLCLGLLDEHRIVIMQRLSTDTETLLKNEFGGRMTLSMAADMICAMLSCLESLHSLGYVHNDVKPENFLIDCDGKIYLIDYGLCTKVTKKSSNESHNGHIGTLRFASINVHKGQQSSPRDDLESLFYCLLYFIIGRLPWQNKIKWKDVQKIKQSFKIKDIIKPLCVNEECIQVIKLLKMNIFDLSFEEIPNYEKLYALLKRIIVAHSLATFLD